MVDIHVAYLVRFDHNDLAFSDSDLAVNYVMFGSEHRKFVGNPDRHHVVIPLQYAMRRDFLHATTFLHISRKPPLQS